MRIPSKRALLPVAAATCAVTQLAAQTDSRPNILYIMSDDHAYQAISAYGDPVGLLAPTPNIDRIARQGMRIDQAFVENSLSAPSRACLITGLYSHQNGQRQLAEGIDTTKTYFSELLQQAGYQTGMVGKWHLDGTPKGFDYYHILYDQGSYYNPVFRGQDTNGKYLREEGYATNLITDHAIEFLEQRDPSKPFCLLVHHKAPHRNWIPALRHLGMYDHVTFPLPATFWDDYATRGSATRTQKMHIGNHMELLNDLKVDTFKNRTYRLSRFVGGLNQNCSTTTSKPAATVSTPCGHKDASSPYGSTSATCATTSASSMPSTRAWANCSTTSRRTICSTTPSWSTPATRASTSASTAGSTSASCMKKACAPRSS